jgi:UDPglucose 6-dehydrogenase
MMNEKMSTIKIGIVGGGFVGKATSGFQSNIIKIFVYDLQPHLRVPSETTIQDIYECDVVFVAVPTPMSKDGSCHYHIVESVVNDLKKNNVKNIVIRSTVPVGTSEKLGVHFMPEFLTEKNWKHDFFSCPTWIIGIDHNHDSFVSLITNIIESCVESSSIQSNKILITSTKEAELIKYTRNCFLATKVSFFNEIYSFCETSHIDYEKVRQGVSIDPRIGPSHTKVPNEEFFNGRIALKKGFSGTCFPKDTSSLIQQFKLRDIPAPVLNAVQYRNTTIDRPEQDWTEDKGRAVI